MEPHEIRDKGHGLLATQIAQVERNINVRRQAMQEGTLLLKQNIRQRLVSPKALITYVGIGLAVGVLVTRRTSIKAAPTSPPAVQTTMDKIERLLAKVFKIVAMGRTLATLLPDAPSRASHNKYTH
jgi:hypothetical protein